MTTTEIDVMGQAAGVEAGYSYVDTCVQNEEFRSLDIDSKSLASAEIQNADFDQHTRSSEAEAITDEEEEEIYKEAFMEGWWDGFRAAIRKMQRAL